MHSLLKSLFLVSFVIFFVAPSWASRDIGPHIGKKIPHNLETVDKNGDMQSFEALVGKKGVVLVFVRSVDWCPYCQAQLIELGERAGEITDLGYNLVSISYDEPQKLARFADKYGFDYPMLSDEDSEIIKAFGILNTEMEKGTRYYGVPHPGVFIISRQRIVQGKFFEDSYKDRPPVKTITESIKSLWR